MRRRHAGDPHFDLVVIGLGSAGLAAARFAVGLGKRVAAVERARIGGDCLWTGCVPSKTLLASARAAANVRDAERFGIGGAAAHVEGAAVMTRVRDVQAAIAVESDSPAALAALGVTVFAGTARLRSEHEVEVDGRVLSAGYVLICTGSQPAAPAIPGLDSVAYLTSDTLWDLPSLPESLVVVGGGAVGCELGQAVRRLGSRVTLLEGAGRILPAEDADLVTPLAQRLIDEGVTVMTGVSITGVASDGEGCSVSGVVSGQEMTWTADRLLVATGRQANTVGLGLEDVGVETNGGAIVTDAQSRTTQANVYAAGDVTTRPRFTHVAAYDATIAVRNMFFPGSASVATLVPRCTFTDPELAQVGLTAAEAEARHGASAVRVHRSDLSRADRGRADGLTQGALALVTVKDRLVGAGVLAPAAGEVIQSVTLAISRRMRLRDLGSVMHIYPTLSWEIALLAAEASYARARRLRVLTRFARR